ncbi:MAG: anti-sigma factor [Naasia sp.]|nr:anti-sigma factor [Naasia sp.]
MKDCYDASSTSGAYSLDALSAAESDQFEGAVETSEGLRAEVDGFRATAAELGLAVAPVEPPAELKADLLARIGSLPQRPADGSAAESAAEGAASAPEEPMTDRREAREHVARRRPRTGRVRAFPALVGAASAVVLFLGGALLGGMFDAVSDSHTSDRFAALNAAADVERSEFGLPNGGTASVVASEELGYSAVVMHDAPSLAENQAFQLWYVDDEGPVSAGVMPPVEDGYLVLEGDYTGGETVAMTVEPAGGSEQPTTDPMILFS